ncbi:hypothetical protein ACIQAA_18515 [Neobacillus sp. NPDC093182]|uniref:hypothetical protein n=1 Tax=Neobacillus sp. NPDC093182 TaxID=3364297 RepID=UPI00382CF443
MKKLSEHSILDNELNKLDSNIIWKKANSNELKQKLITDINKQSYRAKFNRFIGHSVRIGALAAVLFIGFIFISQKVSDVSLINAGNNKEEINQPELPIQKKDETIVYTAEEQNLIESYNASKNLTLTEEATISLDSIASILTKIGEPEIIAKKEKGKVLVNLLYAGDKGLSIQTNINEQGSERLAYESLIKEYPKYLPITSIHNHSAILIYSENQKTHLCMLTDKFIYEISGSKNAEDQIKIAKLINIKNSGEGDYPVIVKENSEIVKSGEKSNTIKIVKLGGQTVISATVSRVGDSMLDVKKPHVSYNQENPNELQTLVDAIQRAEKRVGVFDLESPDYLFILTFEDKTITKYSLWVGNDGGSIMNENDTHTLYKLPKELIDDINLIVK